jgi:hypothetical protein
MIRLTLLLLLLTGCKKKPAEDFNQQLQNRSPFPTCNEDPLFCDDEFDDLPELDESEEATDIPGDD